MSYYDTTSNDLKLAVCRDSACTEATFVVVDAVGNVGQHTSLTLDGNGFPVISYYDVTNADLRLANYALETIIPQGDERLFLPTIMK